MRKKIMSLVLAGFIFMMPVPSVMADESESRGAASSVLTIQQAIDLALQNNRSVKSAQLDVDKSKELRDYAAIPVTFVPTSYTADSANFLNLVAADISWGSAKKTMTATEDAIAYNTVNAYLSILNAQENLNLAEKSLANAKWDLSMSNAGLMVGTICTYDKQQVETAYQTALSNLNSARTTLENAYISFNKLLGINSSQRLQLSEKALYSPIDVTNVESEVSRAVDANPTLWVKDQSIVQANLTLQQYNGNGSYEAKEMDVTKAQYNADEARDVARQKVRTLYNQIMAQEQQYNSQLQTLKTAQETLRIVKLKFDIGMATKAEVQKAELSVLKETATLNSYINQHELNKLVFEKPWVS